MQLVLLFGLPFLFMYIFPVFFPVERHPLHQTRCGNRFPGPGHHFMACKTPAHHRLIRHPYKLKKKTQKKSRKQEDPFRQRCCPAR